MKQHAPFAPISQLTLVQIHLLVGENEKALDRLVPLLKMPGCDLSLGCLTRAMKAAAGP